MLVICVYILHNIDMNEKLNFNPVEVAQVADKQQEEKERIETLRVIVSYLKEVFEEITGSIDPNAQIITEHFYNDGEKFTDAIMFLIHRNILNRTADPELKKLYENINYTNLFKDAYLKNLKAKDLVDFLLNNIREIEETIQNRNKVIVPLDVKKQQK